MELILFIVEIIITIPIVKLALGGKMKPLLLIKNKLKFEVISAIWIIVLSFIILRLFDNTIFNYFSGIIVGMLNGIWYELVICAKGDD